MMVKFECGCLLVRKALALCGPHRDNLERLVVTRGRRYSPWGPWGGQRTKNPWGPWGTVKKSLGARKGVGVSSKTAGR